MIILIVARPVLIDTNHEGHNCRLVVEFFYDLRVRSESIFRDISSIRSILFFRCSWLKRMNRTMLMMWMLDSTNSMMMWANLDDNNIIWSS